MYNVIPAVRAMRAFGRVLRSTQHLLGTEAGHQSRTIVTKSRGHLAAPRYPALSSAACRLVDDQRLTTDPERMWLVPWKEGQSVTVIIRLASVIPIAAIRVWNYNSSQEESYKGVSSRLQLALTLRGDAFALLVNSFIWQATRH